MTTATTSLRNEEILGMKSQSFLLANNTELHLYLDTLLLPTNPCNCKEEEAHRATIDWASLEALLHRLRPTPKDASPAELYTSPEDDPMGRLFLTRILSSGAPLTVVATALSVFPYSLDKNPASFLAATKNSSGNDDVLKLMAYHVAGREEEQCPYPWILSNNITAEDARRVLEAFPEGLLLPSPYLAGESLLDYLLFSKCVIERRTFDMNLWNKFKLVLGATGCLENPGQNILPVHTLLKRALSRQDFWTRKEEYQHIIWLLHHLRSTDRWVFAKQASNQMYPIHVVLTQKCTTDKVGLVAARALMHLLLEAHPEAARVRVNDKLALHMATENGWPCHDLLLAIYPEALNCVDPHTKMFPFQAAARCAANSLSPISLDVTYELLRSNPTNFIGLGG